MPINVAASAIGVSLINRLIGSGIQRLGSLIFQKVIRIARIDNALKNSTSKSSAVQTAISDFEIVIGSRYGQLNENFSTFLGKLSAAAL